MSDEQEVPASRSLDLDILTINEIEARHVRDSLEVGIVLGRRVRGRRRFVEGVVVLWIHKHGPEPVLCLPAPAFRRIVNGATPALGVHLKRACRRM